MLMLKQARILGALFAMSGAIAPGVASADIIDDNSTNAFAGGRSFTALQIGDEVTAGGTARHVSELQIGVNSQGVPATASSLQAFLYANDGTGGAPGTLLWQSAVKTNVALTGGSDLIAFAVPNVIVPRTFTWAMQIGSATPVAAGLPMFGAPTTGSFVEGWFGGPGLWDPLEPTQIFEARITATTANVPEPASITLLCTGLASFGGFHLRRWRRKLSAT
jgi:hypothetical protein